jgi:endonuclease/exonuclease/phosphatase family metal-dependent hydrolase
MYQLKIKRFLSLGTVLLILSGCGGQKKLVFRDVQFSSGQSGVVTVMTFNIRVGTAFWDAGNCWGNRKQIVVDTLIDNAPDVIGLQEALDFQVEHIQQALPKYSRYAVGRNNGKQKGETCAIFYRKDRFELADCGTFWFSKNPEKPGSKRWGNLFPRICTWVRLVDKADAISFYVYNLHLDHLSQNSRNKSVRLLASRIAARKTQDPFIVMGDFNMELKKPAMMYLNKVGYQSPCSAMKNAWLSVNNEKKNIGTRHNFLGGTKGPKIDHIEISENTQALNVKIDRCAVNGRYPSDHFPVIATVRIPTKKAVSMERRNQNLSNL